MPHPFLTDIEVLDIIQDLNTLNPMSKRGQNLLKKWGSLGLPGLRYRKYFAPFPHERPYWLRDEVEAFYAKRLGGGTPKPDPNQAELLNQGDD